jgi:DNA polymerase III subunit alpha
MLGAPVRQSPRRSLTLLRPMATADFVHLRVRSAYSLSEGAIRLDQLAELCRTHAMPAVAVTDSGNLFGALEFATTVAKAGVQPIVGCTLWIRREEAGERAPSASLPPDTLAVLVQSEVGYLNLLKLVSQAALASAGHGVPQLALADLAGRSDGLIALTGGSSGALSRLLGEGQRAASMWR